VSAGLGKGGTVRHTRGSIYRRPESELYWLTYYRDGKRIRESSGSSDYKAAQQKLAQRLGQVDRGEAIDTGRGPTCGDLWAGLERHYRIQQRKSAECLGRRWKHLQTAFAGIAASQVTFDRLEEYVDARLSERASNATINRELSALKTAFRLGRKKRAGLRVPDFPHLTENNTRSGFVEDSQFQRLAANCSESWLRLFLEIAFTFAWRKSEILNLRVSSVSLAERSIRLDVGSTKNGAGREVTMTSSIVALVALAIAGKAPGDYLLTRADRKRVLDFRGAWRKLTAAAGLPNLIVHDLRRSGARQLRRAGVPESVVQAMGGWKTADMFKRYAIVSTADQRDAIEKLEQAREANGHSLGHSSTENGAVTIPSGSGKVQ
jgi:integrase